MKFFVKKVLNWGFLYFFVGMLITGCSSLSNLNPFSQQSVATPKQHSQQVDPAQESKPAKKTSIRVEANPKTLTPIVQTRPPAPVTPKTTAKNHVHQGPNHKCNEICDLPLRRKPAKP